MAGLIQRAELAVKGEVANQTMGPPHWQDGICSCADDMGMCCQTIWCLPCTAASMMTKRELGFAQCDCMTCLCFLVGTYATNNRYPSWLAMAFRRELVQRYGIQNESQCNSCMLGLCCAPCTWCQIQREMGMRREHCGGCCANPPADQGSMADMARNAVGGAINAGGHMPRPWGSGLCGCNGGECVEGICCHCCTYGFVANKMDSERVPGVDGSIQQMDPAGCCGSLWYPQGWIYQHRREVIERYNVQGESHCWSLCYTLVCPFCATLQQRREMGYAGEWPGGIITKECPGQRQN